jgi:tetratricopeptide (TPR) repeat protein/DNA-binding XRE family transcriptional regulator
VNGPSPRQPSDAPGASDGRRCGGCGTPLAADNSARLCGKCHREQRDQLRTPPARLRDEFFDTDEFRAAFASHHIGRVLKAYRFHPRHRAINGKALNQEFLGRWLGYTQAQVSKRENGKPEQNIETLTHIAKTLHLPQRMLWWDLPGQSRLSVPSRTAGQLIVPATRDEILVAETGMDAAELVRRIGASAVDGMTVKALKITVNQLCVDYSHADANTLLAEGKRLLREVNGLLGNRLSLGHHRDIHNQAGMLALLVGCLEYDLGMSRQAEATRQMAMELGDEPGDPGIIGWGHEMRAWFHLTAGNYQAVVKAAEDGVEAAPSHSVAVQLYGQMAKAYARMQKAEKVHEALERGRELLDKLSYPDNPDNHFVVDPDKWDFYAMDAYRIVGRDDLAQRNAEEVIRRSRNPEGKIVSPMRNSEALLTLGVIAARHGDVNEANMLGIQALQNGRQSRPSLLLVANELTDELAAYGPAAGVGFRNMVEKMNNALGGRGHLER